MWQVSKALDGLDFCLWFPATEQALAFLKIPAPNVDAGPKE